MAGPIKTILHNNLFSIQKNKTSKRIKTSNRLSMNSVQRIKYLKPHQSATTSKRISNKIINKTL